MRELASTLSSASSLKESSTAEESNLFKPRPDKKSQDKLKEYQRPDYDDQASGLRQPIVKEETLGWKKSDTGDSLSGGMEDLAKDFEKKVEVKATKPVEESKTSTAQQKKQLLGGGSKAKVNGKQLFDLPTNLCECTEDGSTVVLVPNVRLLIVDEGNFKFFFEILDENMEILYKRQILSDLNYHIDDVHSNFKWVEIKLDTGDITVYACVIPKDQRNGFKAAFARCLFETSNQVRYYLIIIILIFYKGAS